MGRVPITVMGYRCERCGHEWFPRRDNEKEPKVCPKCKSPYWNIAKKQAPMSYEEFCDKIKHVLKSGEPQTWTEVRTKAKLPQKWPNNKWVHRMEKDIALIREKDNNGIIQWKILKA